VNFPEYGTVAPKGAFTGENALYIGNDLYWGFGVAPKTYGEMVKYLIDQYNKDAKAHANKERSKPPKPKKVGEESEETLDGQVPGIVKKEIRRLPILLEPKR
jgi:hypothetical protein